MDPPIYDSIWKYPVMRRPEGGSRTIGHGTTGIICQSASNPEQVIKGPLTYEMRECSKEVVERTLYEENDNKECFEREKLTAKCKPSFANLHSFILSVPHCQDASWRNSIRA
ncbi:hypothetical protein N7493_008508 [Penicillium malachiteum]|uniref:Uncharacterized protein n=1 Tax=Penicillium malachiteum TaxID=1324776 RepID=A0AAD6HHS8_9EURO|nr:hypothetical protein N7493_008508 [Penicillium malachiteum]